MVNLFDSLKEFTWDLLGYFLPGAYVLTLLSIIIKSENFTSFKIDTNNENLKISLFIMISYLLGYVIYGIGEIKEYLFGKYSYRKKIEIDISQKNDFKISKQLMIKKLAPKNINYNLENITVKDLRSMVMSYINECDRKIYTFTFRSEISSHIGNTSFIIGFLGIFFYSFNIFNLFKTDKSSIVLYFFLIITFFILKVTRNRFFDISMNIPFLLFNAKETNG